MLRTTARSRSLSTLTTLTTLAALLPLAAACVADPAESDEDRDGAAVDPVAAETWEYLGPARFAAEPALAAAEVESRAAPDLSQAAPTDGRRVAMRVVDVRAGREHRVHLDRDALNAVSTVARARGFERGSLPDDVGERPDVRVSEGWSGNHDSRVRYTNTTSWPLRTIGTLFDGGGDCTGTRIGPRHVLTAAHCIYNRETSSWNTINFKPGRDGTASAPYGASGPYWYWVPDEYITTGGNGYDIGLIILDTAVGNGWMGYGAWSSGVLNTKDVWMRGYPRCATEGAPAGCVAKTLWGDTKVCELGTYFDLDADGWSRQIKTNCDGSAGQSGSSFYYYTSDGVPASFGVFSQYYCLAGCPSSEHNLYPNVLTRITPEYLAVINWFRSTYM